MTMIKNTKTVGGPKRKVAFFDVDGTIFRSSLLIELVYALMKQGLFPKTAERIFINEKRDWNNRQGSYEDYIMAVVKTFMKHIRGVPYKDFMNVGEKLVGFEKDKNYNYTKELILKLKKKGYFIVAISQSPKGILDKFCKNLNFDKVYGRMYELGPDDEFTGQVMDEHLIENKANIIKRVIEKENLTLKDSYACGDTEGDISMLEMVDRPICFNPNQKLFRYAKINKWPVVVERKDVIYEI